MNNTKLISIVSGVALAGMTLYWRRRERMVRESLTVSRDWEANTNDTGKSHTEDRKERRAATEAADLLNARVRDLPKRITSLDEERRDLRHELDSVRERWADSWWTAKVDEAITTSDDPAILVIELDSGELPDARAFAKRAMEEDAITLVAAHGDGSFAVAVGEALSGEFNAEDIACKIADEAGGGAGGNARLAAGGGATGALSESCEQIKWTLQAGREEFNTNEHEPNRLTFRGPPS